MSKSIILSLLSFLLYIQSPLVFAGPITVTVAEQAAVTGPIITLGEVASISGDDAERIRNLQQAKLGTAPVPGSSVVLTSQLLGMRLTAFSQDASIEWRIPSSLTVTTRSQGIEQQKLIEAATAAIRAGIGSAVQEADLTITPLTPLQDIVAPVGAVQIIADLPYGIRYNTPTIVRVDIQIDGRSYNKSNISFAVKQFQSVVVAAKAISARQILMPEDLRFERMDTSRLSPGYLTDMSQIAGLMIRRSLMPGAVVYDSGLERPVLVKSGTVLNMVARIGDIEVRAIGKALQSGSQGEVIRVQNINSKKIVSARVLDDTAVQVLTLNGG